MNELFHQIVLYGCKLNVVVLEDFESNKSAVYNVLGETNVGGFTISKGFQEYVISYLFKIHYNNLSIGGVYITISTNDVKLKY